MKTIIKDIELTRGNSFGFLFRIKNLKEDLTCCYLGCKEVPEDDNYIFKKSLGDGIEKIDTENYYVKIEPNDTKDIDFTKYYYDLVVKIGADVYTPLKGRLYIGWNVTKEV